MSLTGYSMKTEDGKIYVYTRSDRITIAEEAETFDLMLKKDGAVIKEYPGNEYHDIYVFGEYLRLAASGERYGISEIYFLETLQKVIEVKGYVHDIQDGKIFAYESTEVDGKWARKHFVYDMEGKLLETYVADR